MVGSTKPLPLALRACGERDRAERPIWKVLFRRRKRAFFLPFFDVNWPQLAVWLVFLPLPSPSSPSSFPDSDISP